MSDQDMKKRRRLYYRANKPMIQQTQRDYYLKNRSKILIRQKGYAESYYQKKKDFSKLPLSEKRDIIRKKYLEAK